MKQDHAETEEHGAANRVARNPKRIRVLVVDNDCLSGELLTSALARHRQFETACCDTTTEHVNAAVTTFNPDIVLLDYQLDDRPAAGPKILRGIINLFASSRVIVLFDDGDQNCVIESFRAGAKGVFRRSQPLQQLVRCIEAVHQGQVWATSADLSLILQVFASAAPFQCVNGKGRNLLSPREQQVVKLVAEGLSNHEVAERLQISEHTVKNYLFRIYDKLGISTRVELILYAVTRRASA